VLLFFISVLSLFLSVYVSFSRLNLVSPSVELYSRYDGVPNLSFYLEINVEFESHSSVGVARLFIIISPSLFTRCDKRPCLPSGRSVYKPRCCRSVCSMLIVMLLNFNSKFFNFGLLKGQSVGRKAALNIVAHLATRKVVELLIFTV